MKKTNIFIAMTSLLFFGCAEKQRDIKITEIIPKTQKKHIHTLLVPYQTKVTPVVSSYQNDSKVIVDEGVVLKVWIAPYKIKTTLIAGHDIYTWAKKPSFIVGEEMPKYNSKKNDLFAADNKTPFVFRGGYIDNSKPISNKQVKKYVNNIYKFKAGETNAVTKKKQKNNKFNIAIKQFLEEKKINQ